MYSFPAARFADAALRRGGDNRHVLKPVTFLLLSMAAGCYAQQSGAAPALWNNNSLIAIQRKGGDPAHPGEVRIEFYGHDAFKFTSPDGLTVLTDPWRNDPSDFYGKWFLGEFPAIPVDIVLSTHAHFDHDAVERPGGLMVLERLVGDFKLGDVAITGLADKHTCESGSHHKWDRASADFHVETCPPDNVIGFDNAIQIIETGGLRIAIWGDNRGMPDPALDSKLENLDALILPIDDTGTVLTHKEVDAIVRKYNPRSVIPAHYLLAGVTTDVSGLRSADEWVGQQKDVRRLETGVLTLNAAKLQNAHNRVYYFGEHFDKK